MFSDLFLCSSLLFFPSSSSGRSSGCARSAGGRSMELELKETKKKKCCWEEGFGVDGDKKRARTTVVFGLEMKRAVMGLLAVWIFQSSHVYVRLVFFLCPRLSLAQDPCVICCWCSFILCLLVPQMPILAKDMGLELLLETKLRACWRTTTVSFSILFFLLFFLPPLFFSVPLLFFPFSLSCSLCFPSFFSWSWPFSGFYKARECHVVITVGLVTECRGIVVVKLAS